MDRKSAIKDVANKLNLEESTVGDDFSFLDYLRESGKVNMFGAVPYLLDYDRDLDKGEAKIIFMAWMDSFSMSR